MADITPIRFDSENDFLVEIPALTDGDYSVDITNSSGIGSQEFTVGSSAPPTNGYWLLEAEDLRAFTFQYIEEGFVGQIDLSAHDIKKEDGQIAFFDDGEAYDKYTSTFTAVMEATELNALQVVYNFNRDTQYSLTPQNGGSGFALFTPAFGDVGPFNLKIKSFTQTGTLDNEKYQWFRVKFEVVASGAFAEYSPELGNNEGNLQIGTIGGLRYPLNGFNPEVAFDVGAVGTGMGISYANNWVSQSEITKFKLRLLHDKMSLLLKQLLSNRYETIDLIFPSGYFPYGASIGDDKTVVSRLLTKKIKVTQIKNKRYDVELSFQAVT